MCYYMLFCSVQIQKATPDENQLVVLSCFFGNCHSDEVFRILGHLHFKAMFNLMKNNVVHFLMAVA
jgi:hypothetical protein